MYLILLKLNAFYRNYRWSEVWRRQDKSLSFFPCQLQLTELSLFDFLTFASCSRHATFLLPVRWMYINRFSLLMHMQKRLTFLTQANLSRKCVSLDCEHLHLRLCNSHDCYSIQFPAKTHFISNNMFQISGISISHELHNLKYSTAIQKQAHFAMAKRSASNMNPCKQCIFTHYNFARLIPICVLAILQSAANIQESFLRLTVSWLVN